MSATLADALASGRGIELLTKILNRCVEDEDGCWLWTGAKTKGHGVIGRTSGTRYVHTIVYELMVGPIPEGLEPDHLCRKRACCNPKCIEPVTHKVNSLRGVGAPAVNARKTHCSSGHEFTEKNTYITKEGWRTCRTCHANHERRRRAS